MKKPLAQQDATLLLEYLQGCLMSTNDLINRIQNRCVGWGQLEVDLTTLATSIWLTTECFMEMQEGVKKYVAHDPSIELFDDTPRPNTFRAAIAKIYDAGETLRSLANEMEMDPSTVQTALRKWFGKTGNPRGKTRKLLKRIEELTGESVYTEAA
ncbi:hypothetical protein I6M49_22380 [Shewanella algae]|uniref:helix-turn-helix domain-containing protein n=1 Tax=Shewanella algae TaxID=38313 RepID=UPI001AAE00DE|nr:hypothetical protein [Shewanella algae]MBO2656194.1 hypothetical protein [Shewanella algae]